MLTSRLSWYLHRLRVMGPVEVAWHGRKKLRQFLDDRRRFRPEAGAWAQPREYPHLPAPEQAPGRLREALDDEWRALLAGHWHAFGQLPIQVDDPPRWHCDYLAGCDLPTRTSGFRLNHRQLPRQADIKLIWELSRWSELVRLAQAAYVLGDIRPAGKCLDWLEDWLQRNPPYEGWNWTSALEAGIRMIQFTWIDALLARSALPGAAVRLEPLRAQFLPAHAWFVWRHRSFGTSANNHLLGELAGLLVAGARWPEVERWSVSLPVLARVFGREVRAQFAPDGGHREQALHYHLFSFEFAWQTRLAVRSHGGAWPADLDERLSRAARYFVEVQVNRDPWDYGDSDDAWVTPLFARAGGLVQEWRDWLAHQSGPSAVGYWLGDPPSQELPLRCGSPPCTQAVNDWRLYPDTGMAIQVSGPWFLRWDVSPLGYLRTAAHGHLDALHLSLWYEGVALVIDPGTGAYYADAELRSWLASRAAHNGPSPEGLDWPRRLGPFLWSAHHPVPRMAAMGSGAEATAEVAGLVLRRRVSSLASDGWSVEDWVEGRGTPVPFAVLWQFAPGAELRKLDARRFAVRRQGIEVEIRIDASWLSAEMVAPVAALRTGELPCGPGTVAPSFRRVTQAPCLRLRGVSGEKPCVFRTSFLASRPS